MRWDFHDPDDADEARARQPIVEAMDRWWEAFARHARDLANAFTPGGRDAGFDVPRFTNENLKPIHPDLQWEYGPAVAGPGDRLVITPEGRHRLRPMVRELLRRAPTLTGWEFYPGRLPEAPEVAFQVAEQISRFNTPANLLVKAALGRHRRIDLTFQIPGVGPENEAAVNYVFRATEQLLGEEVLDHWLGVIEVAPVKSLVGKLLGRREPGLVTPERLKPTVDALIAASREQLPEVPPRVTGQRDPSIEVQWSILDLKPPERDDYAGRDDLFVHLTCEPDLSTAMLFDPTFYSGRFSRAGETFCYLKTDRVPDNEGSRAIETANHRGDIEVMINATLGEHGVGCTFGGGTGRRYAYVDLALTDVRRAIPVLRDAAARAALSRRSWLLFNDPEMADEWVGLHKTSPAPMLPADE